MQSGIPGSIRKFPLHARHEAAGARFGAFGSWEVPLYYTTILDEHQAVRQSAGVFDISHMGEFYFSGPHVVSFLEGLLSRKIASMIPGKASYMLLLNDDGNALDDIILYRLGANRFLMIVNAGNVDKDFAFIESQIVPGVEFINASDRKGLLAIQGPASIQIADRVFPDLKLQELPYYHCLETRDCLIARTGYTGEDGFEILIDNDQLHDLWDRLFTYGKSLGLVPAGFGARDTLRLEAGMPLYGHELDETVTPLEAGLGWTLDWTKAAFKGREKLIQLRDKGTSRRLVGFEMIDRGIPRQGYLIKAGKRGIGSVTSGTFGPSLQKNIGMGYVETSFAVTDSEITVQIRDNECRARIVKLPFYKRVRA